MFDRVPFSELDQRLKRFRNVMDLQNPAWELAVFMGKINLYYLTGTMQEGLLLVPRDNDAVFHVRRNYERALDESLFPEIRPMESFRDAAAGFTRMPPVIHLETELIPVALLQRFCKHFPFRDAQPLDPQIGYVRSVKSSYELDLIRKSGDLHRYILEERAPALLKEGMSEMDLAGALYEEMLQAGHHGVIRVGMFDTELAIGHIAFGESSLYPTSFNGPGGNYGVGPAVPLLGNRNRKLAKGDLVFLDVGFGVDGYHTDKTLNYLFGGKPPKDVLREHQACLDIQDRLAGAIRPGAVPSMIYEKTMGSLSPEFLRNFMGYGTRQVKFLGHGVGLVIDEIPVIAKGFDTPLENNTVLALEPKKGIEGVGMVGIENTFVVTPEGGLCITGNSRGLVQV